MRIVIQLVIALVLTAGAWALAANSHFDIFPCRVTETKEGPHGSRSSTRDGSCAVMYVTGDYGGTTERYEMKPEGWALAVLVLTVVPIGLVFGVGAAVRKKKPKA